MVRETAAPSSVESLTESISEDIGDAKSETLQSEPPKEYTGDVTSSALCVYLEETIYQNLLDEFADKDYFIENVQAVYHSKERIEEAAYNSLENIYFGYTLSEITEQFQSNRYIFTVGDDGQTVVKIVGEYDDTFEKALVDVAIGGGIILICVTVSVITGATGAPAASVIFATAAKSAAIGAAGGLFDGVVSGIVEGVATQDMDKALKTAVKVGSEGIKRGAIVGSVAGGAEKAFKLKGATMNGLTMNQAASIQKESQLPTEIIKRMHSPEEYNIYKKAALTPQKVGGKWAFTREIDLNLKDSNGLTNIERIQHGFSPIDELGNPYDLHHIGQQIDSPLAILTTSEHKQNGNSGILLFRKNEDGVHKTLSDSEWNKQRKEFWNNYLKTLGVNSP